MLPPISMLIVSPINFNDEKQLFSQVLETLIEIVGVLVGLVEEFCWVFLWANYYNSKKKNITQLFGTMKYKCLNLLFATDIAPARKPSQKESSLPTTHFQVLC